MASGRDYVLVGRKQALELSYQRLAADFSNALAHGSGQDRAAKPQPRTRVS
jgi:RNase P protein component